MDYVMDLDDPAFNDGLCNALVSLGIGIGNKL